MKHEFMKKKVSVAARYSADNDVTLFIGDCLKLLKQIPDRSARLVVTSPPYNLNKVYESKQRLDQYLELQRSVIAECVRITRSGGSICWQVGNHVNGHGQIMPLDILLHPLFADDLSPFFHPAISRVRSLFEPIGPGDATGGGAEPPGCPSAPSRCMPEALSLA